MAFAFTRLPTSLKLLRGTRSLAASACPMGKPATTADAGITKPFPFPRTTETEPASELAKLRTEAPVCKAKLFDGSDAWLLTRHADIVQVIDDPRLTKVRSHPGFPELSPGGKAAAAANTTPTFVDMDPPEHTKYRGMVEFAFSPEHIDAMRPSIQKTVDELIDAMLAQGPPLDLVEAFALPLPSKVIYGMLGIPSEDHKFVSNNVVVRSSGSGSAKDAANSAQELQDYMHRLVQRKMDKPENDLISTLAVKQVKPGHMTKEQLVQTAFLLLVAGNATTVSMIALGVITLLQHPKQLADLRDNFSPALLESAVEELLRYHTASAYAMRRVAKESVEVHGQVIQPGDGVIALNQSANRDDAVFPDPDAFNIRRSPGPHLAFGYGEHECVARGLARAELQCALGALVKRMPGLKVTSAKYFPADRDVGVTEARVTW